MTTNGDTEKKRIWTQFSAVQRRRVLKKMNKNGGEVVGTIMFIIIIVIFIECVCECARVFAVVASIESHKWSHFAGFIFVLECMRFESSACVCNHSLLTWPIINHYNPCNNCARHFASLNLLLLWISWKCLLWVHIWILVCPDFIWAKTERQDDNRW